ncbi:hypothetical protein [Haloarcula sp. S1AR25-4]|nr:hypothetical protein [Halomicroarcula sp. S1AR25-4]
MSKTTPTNEPSAVCPSCGGTLHRQVGVVTCADCGWVPRQGSD